MEGAKVIRVVVHWHHVEEGVCGEYRGSPKPILHELEGGSYRDATSVKRKNKI